MTDKEKQPTPNGQDKGYDRGDPGALRDSDKIVTEDKDPIPPGPATDDD